VAEASVEDTAEDDDDEEDTSGADVPVGDVSGEAAAMRALMNGSKEESTPDHRER
jgi:hypothetical protein